MNEILGKLYNKKDLSIDESKLLFSKIMSGETSDILISAILTALKIKGETYDEIIGAVSVLREKSLKIKDSEDSIDTCGTGGDMLGTLNISTTAAIVAASSGIKIAKHGNRSVSSKSGSADVLEKLGIKIEKNINEIEDQLKKINFCFMFAQSHHNAMKYVGKVRKELSTRTIFNLIGPLLNPAGSKRQLLGVYDKKWLKTHTEVLKYFGSEHVLVVNGFNGLDEISLSGNTYISELKSNKINEFIFNPQDIGYSLIKIDDIKGGGLNTNIGNKCLFMVGSHVAHDCKINNHVILANNATLAGHVFIDDNSIIGGLAAVHQFVRVGKYAMIGGMSGVEQDIIPYGLYIGVRSRLRGLNIIGLKRKGLNKTNILDLKIFFEKVFGGNLAINENIKLIKKDKNIMVEVKDIIDFIEVNSSRGICTP